MNRTGSKGGERGTEPRAGPGRHKPTTLSKLRAKYQMRLYVATQQKTKSHTTRKQMREAWGGQQRGWVDLLPYFNFFLFLRWMQKKNQKCWISLVLAPSFLPGEAKFAPGSSPGS
jgi:hypothetical protein